MKKVTIYNVAFACLALIGIGALTAFDGSETDEQKVDKAYQVLVDTYNAEQDSLCKVNAMEAAKAALEAEMAAPADNGGEEVQPSPTPPSVGGGSTEPSPEPAPTPAPTPAPEPEPEPTTGKKGKMSGGSDATATNKKAKMSGTTKSGESASASKKKNKMKGKK